MKLLKEDPVIFKRIYINIEYPTVLLKFRFPCGKNNPEYMLLEGEFV